jgi:hypothetical protein
VKFLLSFLTLIAVNLTTVGQTDTTPPYKRITGWPPLVLTQLNKQQLTSKDLKNQATIIMYFSPECDHCKHQTTEMINRIKDLSKYQIILATYQPEEQMAGFQTYYQLQKYPNIRMGRDTKFLLPPFYKIKNLPYLALYNKKGELIKTFDGNVKVDTLLKSFN